MPWVNDRKCWYCWSRKIASLATLKAASPLCHMERPHAPDLKSGKLHPPSLNTVILFYQFSTDTTEDIISPTPPTSSEDLPPPNVTQDFIFAPSPPDSTEDTVALPPVEGVNDLPPRAFVDDIDVVALPSSDSADDVDFALHILTCLFVF